MIQKHREFFNKEFSREKYQKFLDDLASDFNYLPTFRVAETPFFIPATLKNQLIEGCQHVIDFIKREDFNHLTEASLAYNLNVPNQNNTPNFWLLILVYVRKMVRSFQNLSKSRAFHLYSIFNTICLRR
jgi:hypothetical protein